MEPTPDSPQTSYRTRNTVLAVAALVMIVAAAVRLTQTAKEVPPSNTPPVAAQGSVDMTPAATTAAPATGGAIDVEVMYGGGGAISALPDTAKVYVFIRPVGDRMPLAVQTYAPKDLPVVVEFSNPAGASAAAKIEAVARLSLSGAVTLQSGDSEVVSAPVEFGASPAHLSLALGSPAAATPAPVGAAAPVPQGSSVAGQGQGLRIAAHVALGAGIELPPSTTVFVVVRQSGGSPMPLAVKRLTVADLPADLVLTDADAMMPGRTLSGAATVEVVARASRSGDVKAAPGDFEARSGALSTTEIHAQTPIQLVIADPV